MFVCILLDVLEIFDFEQNNCIIYLFMVAVRPHYYSLVVVQGLLTVVASLVAEQGL